MASCTGNGCVGACTVSCYATSAGCSGGCGDSCSFCATCGTACQGSCSGTCGGTCWQVCGSNCSGCTDACTGCAGSCTGSCTGCGAGCAFTCTGCGSGCAYSCSGCTGNCVGTCTGTCSNTCTGTCIGTCTGQCNTACTAEAQAEEIANLGLNIAVGNPIKASDYTQLKAAIDREYTRRGKGSPAAFPVPPQPKGKALSATHPEKIGKIYMPLTDCCSTIGETDLCPARQFCRPSGPGHCHRLGLLPDRALEAQGCGSRRKSRSRKKVRLTGADFFTGTMERVTAVTNDQKQPFLLAEKAKIWYNRSKKRRIFAKRLKSAEGIA